MKKYLPFLVLSLILTPGALEAGKGKKPSSSEEVEKKPVTNQNPYRLKSKLTLEDLENRYKGLSLESTPSESKDTEEEVKAHNATPSNPIVEDAKASKSKDNIFKKVKEFAAGLFHKEINELNPMEMSHIQKKYEALTAKLKNSEILEQSDEEQLEQSDEEQNSSRSSRSSEDYTRTEIDMDALQKSEKNPYLEEYNKKEKDNEMEVEKFEKEYKKVLEALDALPDEEKNKEEGKYLLNNFVALGNLLEALKKPLIEYSAKRRHDRLQILRPLYELAQKEYEDFIARTKKEETEHKK